MVLRYHVYKCAPNTEGYNLKLWRMFLIELKYYSKQINLMSSSKLL